MKISLIVSLTAGAVLVALAAPAANTIYVPTGTNILTIQDGIDAATNGDTVLVADGSYPGGINFKGKLITVKSANGVTSCVIDGNGKDRGVTFTKGEGAAARLEGFTIWNCRSTEGGGIHIESKSAPVINNCIISGNNSPGMAGYGGGVYIYNSSPTITNCTISGNTALQYGGGIWIAHNSSPAITHCVLSANTASVGGGISCANSQPAIAGCTISQNSALDSEANGGGGVCLVNSARTNHELHHLWESFRGRRWRYH
jgi:parallel beta-helix repeat protein